MERKRDTVAIGESVNGRMPGGLDPVLGNPGRAGSFDHGRILGIEDYRTLGLEQIVLILDRGGRQNAVGIVEKQPEVAQPAHAGLRADRGLASLHQRVAKGALLRLTGAVVEVDLLVWTARHAHAPTAAGILVDQDDPVLRPLVHLSL